MKSEFSYPTGNYTLVLSEDELKQLSDDGYVKGYHVPSKMKGTHHECFLNENQDGLTDKPRDVDGHYLTYSDDRDQLFVQFIGIRVEKNK